MKKALYMSLILVLMMSIISACGSNNNNKPSEAASPSPLASPSESASPSEVKTDTPLQKVELKVFMSFPRFKDQFESYFEQFKAKELAEKIST